MAWYWHRIVPLLEQAGHEVIAVDLPGDDSSAGFSDYADIVVRAIEARADATRSDATLVAQSLGGFTAPLVCQRAAIGSLVLVNAMIPQPGETAGAWWGNTRAEEARIEAAEAGGYSTEFDPRTYFLHDVPAAVLRESPQPREQADTVFQEPCRFERWPQLALRVIASANDRFFPVLFQRRVALDRLQMDVEVLPGGHLVALSNPEELADRLLRLQPEIA